MNLPDELRDLAVQLERGERARDPRILEEVLHSYSDEDLLQLVETWEKPRDQWDDEDRARDERLELRYQRRLR